MGTLEDGPLRIVKTKVKWEICVQNWKLLQLELMEMKIK
jgi:hypothetical protein